MLYEVKDQKNGNEKQNSDMFFDNRIEWVRTNAAAEILSRSPGQIRNMVWRGQLKAKKFEGRLYFEKNYLLKKLNEAPAA